MFQFFDAFIRRKKSDRSTIQHDFQDRYQINSDI